MIESTNEIKKIITQAQNGDPLAKNQLIKLMMDNGCMRIINRYLYLNRLLEPSEAKGEFWLGVVLAIPKVNITIGDPLQYLIWKGENHIKSELRRLISQNVHAICKDCGLKFKLYRIGKEYRCPHCGTDDIETFSNEINITTLTANQTEPKMPDVEIERNDYTILDITDFEKHLSKQELRIYKLIIQEGMNRDTCKNYIVEISTIMQISPQCTSIYIKRMREKLKKYMQ